MQTQTFSKLFDHSILRPNATQAEVIHEAETAARLGTATLTVQPHYIRLAGKILQGSGVLVGTVVGFPHGNETPTMKEYCTRTVMDLGAQEIDMVMNIPALKNWEREVFLQDILGVVQAAQGYKVKVILENCFLTQEEKLRACQWITLTGAHFVKTSTAYAEGGATVEDVQLMYRAVAGKCLVKAAGGVRTIEQVLEFLKAGARRFGSTRTEKFVEAFQALSGANREAFDEFVIPAESNTYR
jgi:deoxyribose-phosphate aldolase